MTYLSQGLIVKMLTTLAPVVQEDVVTASRLDSILQSDTTSPK